VIQRFNTSAYIPELSTGGGGRRPPRKGMFEHLLGDTGKKIDLENLASIKAKK
jgi:hypothetical protein